MVLSFVIWLLAFLTSGSMLNTPLWHDYTSAQWKDGYDIFSMSFRWVNIDWMIITLEAWLINDPLRHGDQYRTCKWWLIPTCCDIHSQLPLKCHFYPNASRPLDTHVTIDNHCHTRTSVLRHYHVLKKWNQLFRVKIRLQSKNLIISALLSNVNKCH